MHDEPVPYAHELDVGHPGGPARRGRRDLVVPLAHDQLRVLGLVHDQVASPEPERSRVGAGEVLADGRAALDALLVAACVAVALQVACQVWIRRLADDAESSRPRRPRVELATAGSADHRTFDVLRSAWCRSLTGEVLLLGRTAYPFVAVDRDEPGALADLITGAQGEIAGARGGGLRKVWRELRPALAASPAADGPVNLLGVLRGTAVGRSATFLVFRDPPRKDWLSAATARDQAGQPVRDIRPMAADRARLAPMDPPDWVLDVLVGAPESERGFADEPLVRIARAAQRANYTLLNVRLPAPPPLQDPAERRWLRLRVGAPYRRGDSLRKLVRFLAALDALRAEGLRVHLREVPRMESVDATQTAPEDSFDELPGPGCRPPARP